MKNKKILVTGSSGFVGRKLIYSLIKLNYQILKADIIDGIDLTNFNEVKKIGAFEIAVHLAANTFVPDSFENPWKFYHNNIQSTLNILELCRRNNASVIFSSSYVYGKPEYLPIDEKHPIRGNNPYTQSKIICEKMCEGYFRDHKVPVTILRPSNIYGKGQNKNFLIPKIIEQAKLYNIVLNNSKTRRDYIYVDDVVRAYIIIIENEIKDYRVYNIGTMKSHSVEEIVDIICNYIGKKVTVSYKEKYRKNEIMDTLYNIDKIKQKINWEPRIGLEEGLKELI